MAGHERPREGPAVERLEDRGLDLEVAAPVEVGPQRGDETRAAPERLADLEVHEQVRVALPEPRLRVLEPVPLLGQRAQRLGQQLEGVDPHRDFAGAGPERRPLDPDPVPDVEQLVAGEGLAQVVGAKIELDPAAPVQQVRESGLAVAAQAQDPPREAHRLPRLLGDGLAAAQDVRRVVRRRVAVGVGLHPERPPALELLATLAHEFLERHWDLSEGLARLGRAVDTPIHEARARFPRL